MNMRRILTVLLLAAALSACVPNTPTPEKPIPEKPRPTEAVTVPVPVEPEKTEEKVPDMIYPEAQLLCSAETQEEAEELAELYGITLVKYRNGLARFHTEEDPRAVIRRGEENGWPTLSLNRVSTIS